MLQPASRTAAVLLALALGGVCTADEVFLRGGGRLTGVVVERTKDKVVVETGPGRVTLPMSRVERIVEGRSSLEMYGERAAALVPGDVQGWTELARWAADHDLLTQSREAWQKALAADPSNPEANAALGRVEVDGVWMGREDAYRARGYVPFEGRWVTPAEHEALVRERALEEQAARERREAELRVREAEARARRPRRAPSRPRRRRSRPTRASPSGGAGVGAEAGTCPPSGPGSRARVRRTPPAVRGDPGPTRTRRRLPSRRPSRPRPRPRRRPLRGSSPAPSWSRLSPSRARIDFRLIFAYLLR